MQEETPPASSHVRALRRILLDLTSRISSIQPFLRLTPYGHSAICLVNSLYGVYRNAEEGFVERYFEMLAAGGTKHHSELLAPFGLDASEPGFWKVGLSVIEGLIGELEAMEAAGS